MLRVEYVAVSALQPWSRNARTHSKKQIGQIANSIRRFGFTNPLLIDNENRVLAGHGRLAAAKQLDYSEVPCVRIENMTPAEKRAYVIADNKIAQNAGWDEELLALELKDLIALDPGFETVLGFSVPEIDSLIEGLVPEEAGDPRDDQIPPTAPRRCRPGDIHQLGDHRLICGDARDSRIVGALMGDGLAHMAFTDPPYNVKIADNVSGLGAVKHSEFAMASGEMSPGEFTAFLRAAFVNLVRFSIDGSIHYICMDWRHQRELTDAGAAIFSEQKNLIVWVKDNGGMGSFYRSRHELIFVYKNGSATHLNTFELGQYGRYRTNVWEYRGVNTWKSDRLDELALHPTVKPVQMVADAIKDVSPRGGLVLDLFGGSGSTLIAAQKVGRRARLVEYDPIFCDRIIHRWEKYAKDEAELIACGWTPGAQQAAKHEPD